MSRFLAEKFKGLEPYTPGEQPRVQKYIKLNTNENPYPPSERVVEAISAERVKSLRLYSDIEARPLVEALARYYGVGSENVICGNGSDEILAFFFLAFNGGEKKVCFPDISYGFYPVYCSLFGIDYQEIPLREDFSVAAQDYCSIGKNVVIANPNAPTGIAIKRAEIEEILKSNPDNIVLIDEAYVDFGGESCIPLIDSYDNLIVTGTFSKSRNLAGARIGFAVSSKEIIEDMNKMKFSFNPYNLNSLSIAAGVAAVEDDDYFKSCVSRIVATREYTVAELEKVGFEVLPSSSNFIFARSENISGADYYTRLRECGILVRHFKKPRIKDFVRITIGGEEDMKTFVQTTKQIVEGAEN